IVVLFACRMLRCAVLTSVFFKGWEESWSKRCLIEHAIGAIVLQRGRREARRDLWPQERGENKLRTFLDAVTQLKSTERFVFVMTVLEGYSVKETALLLDRTPESVHNLRIEALQRLAELNPGNDRDSSSSGALRNCNRELRLKREIKHEDCLAWAQ